MMIKESLLKLIICIAVPLGFYISVYIKRKIANLEKPGCVYITLDILIFIYMIISFFCKEGKIIY